MSNTNRPAQHPAQHPAPSTDRPTATFPTGQWLDHLKARRERLADLWADRTPTELLPVVPAPQPRPASARTAPAAGTTFPRVSTHRKPTAGRVARRTAPTGTKGLRRRGTLSRHLRAALAALALAAAILIPMQLFAAQGISSARQAALTARTEQAEQTSASAAPLSGQSTSTPASPMSGQSPAQPDWVTEDASAAYDRTNPAASPLDLPRCTTSPDTPLPCLATISPDSRRAVVLEEDASLTALVRR